MRPRARDDGHVLDQLVGATCYTTMMPCEMCAGAIIRFGLAAVVVAEVASYQAADTRSFLEERGIEVEIRDEEACQATVESYYAEHPQARGASRPSDYRWPRLPVNREHESRTWRYGCRCSRSGWSARAESVRGEPSRSGWLPGQGLESRTGFWRVDGAHMQGCGVRPGTRPGRVRLERQARPPATIVR